jgi:Tfp pilus assembly protein PilX
MNISKKRGFATLLTVMVIGMMALAIVVSITSLALNELLISQGQAESSSALFYAEAGGRDALIRIARDKNYTCGGSDCYSIDYIVNGCTNNTNCSKVSVSSGTGVTGDPKIITSKGIMKSSIRTVQVTVTLDNGTSNPVIQNGQITSTVWTELTN